jgi:hypothetical protein
MNNEVHFKGAYSRELFVKAQRLHWKRRRLFVLIASATLILVGPLLWMADPARIGGMAVLATGVLGLISLALGPRRWSRIYDNTPYLTNEVRGIVSPASYTVETASGKSEIPWSQFVRVEASDEYVLLYRGPNVFNCFAKSFFKSDDDWQKARFIALEMAKGSS